MRLSRKAFFRRIGHALGSWHSSSAAWLVLALSALISIAAWHFSSQSVWRKAEVRFEAQALDMRDRIVTRMDEQQVALKGGVGLFSASQNVTREEWRRFYNSLETQKLLPGLQGFGFAALVDEDGLRSVVRNTREEGFPDFAVSPAGSRPQYAIIAMLEPFDQRNQRAFGYDMWSEPTRRAAMERARDTGAASVSGMVTLVQEDGHDLQRGFLMYLPLYEPGKPVATVADRRAAIAGFVYSPFRVKDLMTGILGSGSRSISLRIYDGTTAQDARLLYNDAEESAGDDTQFTSSDTVYVHGHPWHLVFSSNDSFVSASEEAVPTLIAGAAVIIDVLLFFTILTMGNQRQMSMHLVETKTLQLKRSKERAERAALREGELRQAAQSTSERLLESNRELTRFASIVAHDLRAPLKRIECFVDILQDDYASELDAEAKDVADRIRRNATRMRMMLDSLHDYTRVSNLASADQCTNLQKAVDEVIDGFGPDLGQARVTIEIEPECCVNGDTYLLQHVLQNLISNALKFRGTSPPNILVQGRTLEDGNVELSVADDGIGIEPEFAGKVFDMFTRLHDDDEYEGTGIGLAVCRKIINDHDARIFVDTEWTAGTRIVMRFPPFRRCGVTMAA